MALSWKELRLIEARGGEERLADEFSNRLGIVSDQAQGAIDERRLGRDPRRFLRCASDTLREAQQVLRRYEAAKRYRAKLEKEVAAERAE